MEIILSERLTKIASFVKPGSKVIDVGTDHAYIPIWLITNNICKTVVATDIHSGPLQKAKSHAFRYNVGDKISFVLCDGLTACSSDSCDTIIIAGLGGDTIISILENAPWSIDKKLIIQSQTKHDILKKWLRLKELSIVDGCLVYENNHFYSIWVIQKGFGSCLDEIEPIFFEKKDPLLLDYINNQIEKISKQILGLKKSAKPNEEIIIMLENRMDYLYNCRNEVIKWQL